MRLVKIFKVLKNKDNLSAQFSQKMQINSGTERLIFSGLIFFFVSHVCACVWVLLGQMQESHNKWYTPRIEDLHPWKQYVLSMYFTVTTMTTVGYGDISAETTTEHCFCFFLMIFGVISFTFISGALSSILSNVDNTAATLQEKLLFLNKLQMQYRIKGVLYQEIRKALNYDNKTMMVGLDAFIDSLPPHLNQAVTLEIHKNTFVKHHLFRKLNNKRLLAYIGSRLHPRFDTTGCFLYK